LQLFDQTLFDQHLMRAVVLVAAVAACTGWHLQVMPCNSVASKGSCITVGQPRSGGVCWSMFLKQVGMYEERPQLVVLAEGFALTAVHLACAAAAI
jgi:hypothetical protein